MSSQKRSLTASLLVLYNILLLIFAVVLLAASAYVNSQFRDDSWESVLTQEVSSAGIVAGVLTALLALLGLYAASLRKRRLLTVYLFCLVIIVSLQFSAAAGLTIYSDQFQIRDDAQPSGSLTSTVDITINNMAFSMYTVCCTGCLPGMCTNKELPPAMINTTNPNCGNSTCTFVQPCTSTSQQKCFKFTNDSEIVVPPYAVSPDLCPVLGNVKGQRSPRLVGPATTGACGAGDPTRFLQDLDAWTSSVAFNSAIVFYLVASIELIVLMGGVYLLCCASRETVANLTGFNVDEADEDWQV